MVAHCWWRVRREVFGEAFLLTQVVAEDVDFCDGAKSCGNCCRSVGSVGGYWKVGPAGATPYFPCNHLGAGPRALGSGQTCSVVSTVVSTVSILHCGGPTYDPYLEVKGWSAGSDDGCELQAITTLQTKRSHPKKTCLIETLK